MPTTVNIVAALKKPVKKETNPPIRNIKPARLSATDFFILFINS